ncbi:conserved hypothetical protein (plasmid) [Persephonella marina EX-H1]|uniref:Uncharacterized protein n=1 Tax=Persephonella marina (strain DSM 14350 / EX-H1) TaxID=123214 RepID=C0QUY5_PERMH|nr:hypothetical protein [Persephonella marina]ACO04988.1 conserved hypothetical protein [Persephonella marina EX-H1]
MVSKSNQNHQSQYKHYHHPYFPELEVLEDASGNKSYYISVDNLPEVPKKIFQTIETLKELQQSQFLSYSFKSMLKSEIQILEQKLNYELVKHGYPYDTNVIPF